LQVQTYHCLYFLLAHPLKLLRAFRFTLQYPARATRIDPRL
jgi:hypothetical protein